MQMRSESNKSGIKTCVLVPFVTLKEWSNSPLKDIVNQTFETVHLNKKCRDACEKRNY